MSVQGNAPHFLNLVSEASYPLTACVFLRRLALMQLRILLNTTYFLSLGFDVSIAEPWSGEDVLP